MKNTIFKMKRLDRNLFLFLSFVVWIYILLRSIYSPIIHDEAETFFIYIQSGNFLPPHSYLVANNHLLNSFLTYISWKTFGTSLWALRLPNVLSALLFFYYIYKLSHLMHSRINKWVFILSLLFTHYIIEFFGYTRGYGLSMAFYMGAIYHLISFYKNQSLKDTLLLTIYSILALSANLGLMNTFVLLHGFMILFSISFFIQTKDKTIFKSIAIQSVVGLPAFLYLLNYTFLLKSIGSLEIGSSASFFNATLGTLSPMLFRLSPLVFKYSTALILAFVSIYLIYLLVFKTKQIWQQLSSLIFPLIFMGNILMSILLSLLFDINYPEHRTALYFVPLFIGSIVFIADTALFRDRFLRYLLFIPLILSMVQFLFLVDLNFSSYTPNYRIPEKYYDFLLKETKKREVPPVVEAYKEHRTEWYFTNLTKMALVSPLAHQIFPSNNYEYVISDEIDFPNWKENYNSILYDNNSRKHLLKRRKELNLILIDSSYVSKNDDKSHMYFNLYQNKSIHIDHKNILFMVDLKVESPANPFHTAIIAKANTPDHPAFREAALELERIRPEWSSDHHSYKFSLVLPEIPENTNEVLIFLFNKEEAPFRIIEAKTFVYSYD